ncbi:hypothetical protein CV102_25620 [Natronococcus pandeyae]|uniref:Uncharacterized protein n=2 Tax=Natronococcus pandeyae TaxID=2055836 RepID=A0A8J8PXZ4_9EURY|nr:hypothetical protein CV102_25620 [Natronococcus pandeyae]
MELRITNDADLHNNRAGAVSAVELEEGQLVGLNASGQIVEADADSAAPVKAVGVSLTDVMDLDARAELEPAFRATLEAQRTLVGKDRVAFADHGIDLIDLDEGSSFTPGEPVYLAVGGGFTSVAPDDGAGELVQVVGYALTEDKIRLSIQF